MSTSRVPAAKPGEVYVEIDGSGKAFPALIDTNAWNGWAKPSFRKPVVSAIIRWLNQLHETYPQAWTYAAEFSGDTLLIVDTEQHDIDMITPDADGLWSIGRSVWCWNISAPEIDSGAELALLRDADRLIPEDGEELVTINYDCRDPAFPALIADGHGEAPTGAPRFRRSVAEVVVAWLNDVARRYEWRTDRLYWDDDTIVLVEYERVDTSQYLPQRFGPDADGRYCVDDFLWEYRPMPGGDTRRWATRKSH